MYISTEMTFLRGVFLEWVIYCYSRAVKTLELPFLFLFFYVHVCIGERIYPSLASCFVYGCKLRYHSTLVLAAAFQLHSSLLQLPIVNVGEH